MAGALEGQYEGHEMDANDMPKWTAEEYQSRFTNGGAFLFIPRAPEEDNIYWDASELVKSLKAAIDDFCSKNPCVDTSRIYAIGWCLGASGIINLTAAYPDDFAATIIMCPSRPLTITESKKLSDMPVWLMGCYFDTYSFYPLCTLPSWHRLKLFSNRPDDLRMTTYMSAPDVVLVEDVPFIDNHNMWDNVAEDMHLGGDGYVREKTVDGRRNVIENPYVISWLCSFVKSDGAAGDEVAEAIRPVLEVSDKATRFYHEDFRNAVRLKIFDILTVIYKAFGWL